MEDRERRGVAEKGEVANESKITFPFGCTKYFHVNTGDTEL